MGSNPDVDIAIALQEQLLGFLRQSSDDQFEFPRTCRLLIELQGIIEAMRKQIEQAGQQVQVAAHPGRVAGADGMGR